MVTRAAALAAAILWWASAAAGAGGWPLGSMRMSVSTSAARISPGRPVVFTVRVRYQGPEPLVVGLPRWPFRVEVRDAAGRPVWAFRVPETASDAVARRVVLRPGQAVAFTASWVPGPRTPPGMYRIVAVFRPAGLTAEAWVQVRPREPAVFASEGAGPGATRWPLAALGAVVGAFLGSFSGVLGFRVPAGKSPVWPPSSCDSCGRRLAWHENVPVVSWALLRGRCRTCGAPVPWVYPAVELASALFLGIAAWRFGDQVALVAAVLFCVFLGACVVSDAHYRVIPDWFTMPALAAGLVASAAAHGTGGVVASSLSAIGAGGFLLAASLASSGGMGGGDVKMAAAVGAFLGPKGSAVAMFVALVLGGLYAAAMVTSGRMRMKSTMAFGPFIAAGAAVSALFGIGLYRWYLGGP